MGQLLVSFCIFSVLVTCSFSVYSLELIIREAPQASNIVTFAQFLFIFLEGFVFTTKFCTRRRTVPLGDYLYLVITFFLVSVSNNLALSFIKSMPLHIIFKSGSLIANMILGIVLLNKTYKSTKYLGVVMISVGICICTIASASYMKFDHESRHSFNDWIWGIFLLSFALVASARMGLLQETIHRRYGKNPQEGLFYCHALPLPGFLVMYSDIIFNAGIFSKSAPLPWAWGFPRLWVFLLMNAISQYFCARSVFTLTSECSSLAVTLVLTLRKFVSLVISIYYFQNPFTWKHWLGTFLVFFGTAVFMDIFGSIIPTRNKMQLKSVDDVNQSKSDQKEK